MGHPLPPRLALPPITSRDDDGSPTLPPRRRRERIPPMELPDTFGQFPPSPPRPLYEPPNAPSPHHPSDDDLDSGLIALPHDASMTKRTGRQAEGINAKAAEVEEVKEVKEKGGGNGKGKAKGRGKEKESDKKKEKEKEKEKEKGKGKKDKRGGCTQGSRNFSSEEMAKLVHLVREELPIGAAGWEKLTSMYNVWAKDGRFHERDVKSLRGKFDAVCFLLLPPLIPSSY